jgi:hypothetical protein
MHQNLAWYWFLEAASGVLRSWTCESPFHRSLPGKCQVARLVLVFLAVLCSTTAAGPKSSPVQFKAHVIESKIPSGYSLLVADMNRDGRPDVIGLSTRMSELAWYENPNWERHVLVREMNGLVNMAAHDVDGDGFPELALENEFSMVAAQSQGLVCC